LLTVAVVESVSLRSCRQAVNGLLDTNEHIYFLTLRYAAHYKVGLDP